MYRYTYVMLCTSYVYAYRILFPLEIITSICIVYVHGVSVSMHVYCPMYLVMTMLLYTYICAHTYNNIVWMSMCHYRQLHASRPEAVSRSSVGLGEAIGVPEWSCRGLPTPGRRLSRLNSGMSCTYTFLCSLPIYAHIFTLTVNFYYTL